MNKKFYLVFLAIMHCFGNDVTDKILQHMAKTAEHHREKVGRNAWMLGGAATVSALALGALYATRCQEGCKKYIPGTFRGDCEAKCYEGIAPVACCTGLIAFWGYRLAKYGSMGMSLKDLERIAESAREAQRIKKIMVPDIKEHMADIRSYDSIGVFNTYKNLRAWRWKDLPATIKHLNNDMCKLHLDIGNEQARQTVGDLEELRKKLEVILVELEKQPDLMEKIKMEYSREKAHEMRDKLDDINNSLAFSNILQAFQIGQRFGSRR